MPDSRSLSSPEPPTTEAETPLRSEYLPGDGVRLHVVRGGEGPAVLLLHGFPEHWISWRRQAGPLVRAGFSVLIPDLRGYGDSERPAAREAYHLRHLVADAAALIRDSGHPRAHVVGHDWGGIIAWTLAGHHPELVDRLVILNAPHLELYVRRLFRSSQLFRSWYVLFFQVPGLAEWALSRREFTAVRRMFREAASRRDAFSEASIEEYVRALDQPGALTAAASYYRANRRPDPVRLARSARPSAETLVLWGEQDPALDVSLLKDLNQVAPRVRVERFPEAGHWLQNEAPEAVNRALLAFFNERSAGG